MSWEYFEVEPGEEFIHSMTIGEYIGTLRVNNTLNEKMWLDREFVAGLIKQAMTDNGPVETVYPFEVPATITFEPRSM